jgi:hypothetical protein
LLFAANTASGPALVYVLVEHQSAPDRYMALRLFRYVGRILDAHRRRVPDATTLPPVLPVVLYHAERPWPYPLDMASLYSVRPVPEAWAPYAIDFRFALDDLARAPILELATRPVSPLVAVALCLLKLARHAADLLAELEQISHVLAQLDASPVPDEQASALFTYTWTVGRVEVSEMRDFVRQHTWPNLENAVMTAAEKLKAEGRREGRQEGQQVLVRALLRQMRAKFPELPAEIERRVETASIDQLERWLEKILAAQRAEDVLSDS